MFVFIAYILGYISIGGLIYIFRPELVESFSTNFPNLTSHDIPISLLIFNYTFLAIGLSLLNKEEENPDLPLISGGIIAATSISLLFNLSFIFNILWSAINQKYLIAIIIIVYACNLGVSLFTYGLKKSSSNKKSNRYQSKELISKYKTVIAELKLETLHKKLDIAALLSIEAMIEHQEIKPNELVEIKNQLKTFGIVNQISQKLQEKISTL